MKMKNLSCVITFLIITINLNAQSAENLFIITLDGLRWQELFYGADSLLVDDSGYSEDHEKLTADFWDINSEKRRQKLMPFFWDTIVRKGQLHGNRKYGSMVNVTNGKWFSYPGYSEILCGFADDENITSNDKVNNPNVTILEILNGKSNFKGRVAAFGSWDVFPYIINTQRSKIPVNAGFGKAEGDLTETETFLNKIQDEIRGPWSTVRLDVFTHHFAMEYIKKKKPRVVYLSYGETDDWAHDGKYDQYLYSAQQTDAYIKELWDYLQSDQFYKDKTAIIITTDHGRGTNPKDQWKGHGSSVDGADQIWIAAFGTGIEPIGEVKKEEQLYQNQIAATALALLGQNYNQPKAGKKIELIKK